ncbi:glycosyltransferase family 4 protein [Bradyrhizobium sp. LHD-71]|uniref:glycosyltransferase family 4 protein n=1 Tax=Bradyrhizobium sp. LHD-71 TaxID=3072141 RepID=UPI00280C62F3|nr:glycosyltransferase family 4 protein [Bradyrhizobium sp. LHD-71]MDQ8727816.1 glycosyltransferase family 4 protein [Bradyrhizobium sp. LHD-71]
MTTTAKRLRVAMMISGTGINGAIIHTLLLTRYLARQGHKILLLHRPNAWITQQSGLNEVELFETSFGRSPHELIRVTRRINRFGPEVIQTHMSSAHTYGMLTRILSRRPVVATAHSQSIQLHWCFNNIVIATSPGAAEHHRRRNLVPRSALRVQANFIETTRFPLASDAKRKEARRAFGFDENAFVIGSVGFIDDRKNQLDLARALGEIVRAVPEARLLLVGGEEPDYGREIRRTAEQLGVLQQIVFTGPRQDIADVLAAMDTFALVSRKETGPLAALEAMSSGLPVLATKIGMLPDFVRDGAAGFIVEVGDIPAIADRLITLARDPARRRAMGHAAHEIARNDYDVDIAGPRIEAILAEAAQIKNRPLLGFVAGLCGKE